jgi:AcrR family transcriptional regulator
VTCYVRSPDESEFGTLKRKSAPPRRARARRELGSPRKRHAGRVFKPRPADATTTQDPTSDRILHTAERLFADLGYNNVSVRDIAAKADVNSALIRYHFGSKEGLLVEVYKRHCEPLIEERMRGLAAALNLQGRKRVEGIIEAFVRPALAQVDDEEGKAFIRLRAVLSGESSELLEKLVAKNFDESSTAFVDALCDALPHRSRTEICWRFHFLLGAIYYTAAGPHRIYAFSKGKCDPSDREEVISALVPFMTQAFY